MDPPRFPNQIFLSPRAPIYVSPRNSLSTVSPLTPVRRAPSPIIINPSPRYNLPQSGTSINSSGPLNLGGQTGPMGPISSYLVTPKTTQITAPIPTKPVSILYSNSQASNLGIQPQYAPQINRPAPRIGPLSLAEEPLSPSPIVNTDRIVSIEGLMNAVGSRTENHPTHLRFYPRSTFRVDDAKLHTFWAGYCQLASNEITNQTLTMGEAITPGNVPVVGEIKLEFYDNTINPNDTGNMDDTSFIYALVNLYQTSISSIINLSEQKFEFAAIVLKSGKVKLENGNIAYYYRIHFPYCRVSMDLLEKFIRPLVVDDFDKCLHRINAKPIGSKEMMIKSPFINGFLPLYLSKSRASSPLMRFSRALGEVNELSIEEPSADLELNFDEFFKLETHTHATKGILDISRLIEDTDHEYWLPIILSINYWTEVARVAPEIITSQSRTPPCEFRESGDHNSERDESPSEEENDEDPVWIARQLLPFLSSARFSNEHYWFAIGEALFNITDGSDDGLKWWIRQSMIGRKYGARNCQEYWNKWRTSSDPVYCTVKTIAYFAREDRPDKYQEWLNNWCRSSLVKATTIVHTDVATALYRIYWLDYCCSSVSKRGSWYMFDNHHWRNIDGGVRLRKVISRDFKKFFERMRTTVSRKIENMAGEGHVKSSLEMLITKIGKLIEKLGNQPFKRNIMAEAAEHFYDENFSSYMDANPNIMGVYNGVIETTRSEAVFRAGKPEDYLTMYSYVRYDPNLTEKSESVRYLQRWLMQTFMDRDLIEMFLRLMSSRLRSRNSDKKFPIFSGKKGDNSKSMWKKLFEQAFGPYSITLSEAILTEKPSAKGPSPELARANKTKIAWIAEPDEDDPIRNAILKKLTGGDSFFARFLHENGSGDMLMTFMLFMMCNRIPSIPKSEKTIYERLFVVPFLSRWALDAPDDPQEQYLTRTFKRDPYFEDKIPTLTAAILWILVQKYADYRKYGLEIPKVVEEYTAKYWQETDVYHLFKQDKIELVVIPGSITEATPNGIPDESVWLEVKDVFSQFVLWYQNNMQGLKVPIRATVIDELTVRWGQPSEGRWKGIQIKGA